MLSIYKRVHAKTSIVFLVSFLITFNTINGASENQQINDLSDLLESQQNAYGVYYEPNNNINEGPFSIGDELLKIDEQALIPEESGTYEDEVLFLFKILNF